MRAEPTVVVVGGGRGRIEPAGEIKPTWPDEHVIPLDVATTHTH
jgi:hypothetical protein